jgi:predicted dehydrogenase
LERIRVGLIGTPNWAREAHIKNLLRLSEEAEIVSLWNRGVDNLHKAAAMIPNARLASSADELLNDLSIQAVIVTLPPDLNVDFVPKALRAGKHVLCEKPLSNTLAGCQNIVDAARATGKIPQVGFELRYSEFYRTFRNLIDRNQIGKPAMIIFKSFSGVGWAYREGTWIVDPGLSGGVMNSWGVHPIDLMNDLAGAAPQAVYATGDVKVRKQTSMIDNGVAIIEYQNGVNATLLYCRFSPHGNDWELTVIGDSGKIDGQLNNRTVRHFGVGNETETVVKLAAYEGDGFAGALGQLRMFLRYIREGVRPPTDVEAGFRATQVALAIEQSIREKRRIEL